MNQCVSPLSYNNLMFCTALFSQLVSGYRRAHRSLARWRPKSVTIKMMSNVWNVKWVCLKMGVLQIPEIPDSIRWWLFSRYFSPLGSVTFLHYSKWVVAAWAQSFLPRMAGVEMDAESKAWKKETSTNHQNPISGSWNSWIQTTRFSFGDSWFELLRMQDVLCWQRRWAPVAAGVTRSDAKKPDSCAGPMAWSILTVTRWLEECEAGTTGQWISSALSKGQRRFGVPQSEF